MSVSSWRNLVAFFAATIAIFGTESITKAEEVERSADFKNGFALGQAVEARQTSVLYSEFHRDR